MAHPGLRVRPLVRLVAALRNQIEVLIRGIHHIEAAREFYEAARLKRPDRHGASTKRP